MFESPDSNVSEGHEMMKQGRSVMLNVMFLSHDKGSGGDLCWNYCLGHCKREFNLIDIIN